MAELKRLENNGDRLEACFHGEIWMKCRLCGRAYEAHSEKVDKETGKRYCPWCDGYGRADNG